MNKYPRHASELSDLKEACRKFVLPGYVPEAPALDRTLPVWTMGSCFAENIAHALGALGVTTRCNKVGEHANSPPMVAEVMRALFKGEAYDQAPQEAIIAAQAFIRSSQAAILTLGVGAAGFDRKGNLLARGEPDQWRALRFNEVSVSISKAVKLLQAINPKIVVFLTLSPVPLNQSFWKKAVVVADCESKTTIRAALTEYLRDPPKNVYYWPAFEMVRWLGAHRPNHYGADDELQRHVSHDVVKTVVDLFIETWFKP